MLLKGVNDKAEVLAERSWRLLEARGSPYCLHHCDRAPGTAHLRTSLEEGREIFEQLGRLVSGPGLPRYVVDLPDGSGKVDVMSIPKTRLEGLIQGGIEQGSGSRIGGFRHKEGFPRL